LNTHAAQKYPRGLDGGHSTSVAIFCHLNKAKCKPASKEEVIRRVCHHLDFQKKGFIVKSISRSECLIRKGRVNYLDNNQESRRLLIMGIGKRGISTLDFEI